MGAVATLVVCVIGLLINRPSVDAPEWWVLFGLGTVAGVAVCNVCIVTIWQAIVYFFEKKTEKKQNEFVQQKRK